VLCAYLGQLAKVRDALATEVAVVIDDRDQIALADREGDEADLPDILATPDVEHFKVTKRVRMCLLLRILSELNTLLSILRFVSGRLIIIKARKRRYNPLLISFCRC
jgi:hypothetical protein